MPWCEWWLLNVIPCTVNKCTTIFLTQCVFMETILSFQAKYTHILPLMHILNFISNNQGAVSSKFFSQIFVLPGILDIPWLIYTSLQALLLLFNGLLPRVCLFFFFFNLFLCPLSSCKETSHIEFRICLILISCIAGGFFY